MTARLALAAVAVLAASAMLGEAHAQVIATIDRDYADIKLLDAYFGTADGKIEVNPGDGRVPFTILFANVGTLDITGVRGELSMPLGFSAADGSGPTIPANADSNARPGELFHMTFFVDISDQLAIGEYPATVKADYSRLRESGVRSLFFDFGFRVTGSGLINANAQEPFLTSLQENEFAIEVTNDGTASISGVTVEITEDGGGASRVVIPDTEWSVGSIGPGETLQLTGTIYVPDLSGEILGLPLAITYFDAHGEQRTVTRVLDFYIMGLIDVRIDEVEILEISDEPVLSAELVNEGNEDALFAFVVLSPGAGSNIRETTHLVGEIGTDGSVPFEIEIEFDGAPRYGEHDVEFVVRYKDSLRGEHFAAQWETITIPQGVRSSSFDRDLRVTGGSVINANAQEPFLTALQDNEFAIILSNNGTEPISGVSAEITEGSESRVVIPDTDWSVGAMAPGESRSLPGSIYVPELATGDTFSIPLEITYFNAYGDRQVITRSVDFYVRATAGNVINANAQEPFLTALQDNEFAIILSNNGTEPISGVSAEITEGSESRVVIPDTDWSVGAMAPGESRGLPGSIYVPELTTGDTFSIPLEITYFNAYGDRQVITRSVDFYVRGLVDVAVYNVRVLEFSGTPTVVGEIINEGNENALFGFVTMVPGDGSNVREATQFVDEIEIDSPVPFNIPVEFDGTPRYGDHEIEINVRYKDQFRSEHFVTYRDAVTVLEPAPEDGDSEDGQEPGGMLLVLIAVAAGAVAGGYAYARRRKRKAARAGDAA